MREVERAEKAAERARLAAQRANAADRKAAEKEAARLHVEAREAEVEALNAELASTYNDIDTLLEGTLEVDDYVDLESLKTTPQHPEFARQLAQPIPAPVPPTLPAAPVYEEPPRPNGLPGALGGKKKHAAAVEATQLDYAATGLAPTKGGDPGAQRPQLGGRGGPPRRTSGRPIKSAPTGCGARLVVDRDVPQAPL